MIRLFALIALVALTACTSSTPDQTLNEVKNTEWPKLVATAEESTVRLFMWGGDKGINEYIDEWVTPQLKKTYDIQLERIPMDTDEILNKLQTEKRAGKTEGTIDILWLNGENFKTAKEHDLLAGAFVESLPNYRKYYDSPSFQTDFGTSVDGLEAPWGKVQFVFFYDKEKVPVPPSSFQELKKWIKDHPGKFTYPNADDFTGNAFLRHILYAQAAEPAAIYNEPLDKEVIKGTADDMWEYLNGIEPFLWREGKHYPNSLTELDRLYSQGEVWMTMGYNEARAESLIQQGVFPETTRSFVMEPGSIGNTHFLSIPFNSTNFPGALTAINFMLSPEAQLVKMKPDYWGENTAISLEKLPEEMRMKFESIDRGESVLPSTLLEESYLPESDAAYVTWMKEQWFNEVVQK